jgi:hypothetical protein
MDHTPSPTPGGPDPGPSMPPPDHPDVEREESPDKRKQGEEPGIAYEEDIPSDGEDPEAQAEIRHVPAKPELSPAPDRLRN